MRSVFKADVCQCSKCRSMLGVMGISMDLSKPFPKKALIQGHDEAVRGVAIGETNEGLACQGGTCQGPGY